MTIRRELILAPLPAGRASWLHRSQRTVGDPPKVVDLLSAKTDRALISPLREPCLTHIRDHINASKDTQLFGVRLFTQKLKLALTNKGFVGSAASIVRINKATAAEAPFYWRNEEEFLKRLKRNLLDKVDKTDEEKKSGRKA
ncbi:hypothetical protein M514_12131 [Trichuris suis]|uniref:Uncharacterized protein n=1 Tax=Trichuris suis TaxID=68888 RepID=A0A085MXC5_9BILA|nr:hypothetical protein M514_12131 [Trichuris suis]